MYCTKCGYRNSDDSLYCVKCGNRLQTPAPQAAPAQQTPAQQAPAPQFEYKQPAPAPQSEYRQPPQAPQNVQPVYVVNASTAPVGQLKTNRGMIKFILLNIITFGIYGIVFYSSVSSDINVIASRYDGKKTMHFCLLFFIFSWLTLGIGVLVWFSKISSRIGDELERRRVDYSFGASKYWLWNILGTLIFVGPFIYLHKLSKAMNKLAENYNRFG